MEKKKIGKQHTALNCTRETTSESKLPQVTSSSYIYWVCRKNKGGNNVTTQEKLK